MTWNFCFYKGITRSEDNVTLMLIIRSSNLVNQMEEVPLACDLDLTNATLHVGSRKMTSNMFKCYSAIVALDCLRTERCFMSRTNKHIL